MGQKDIAERALEDYNDVFADIFNGLVFHGKPVIQEEDLIDAQPSSHYKADGKLHSQHRDVAKYWRNCNMRIAFLGIENQTSPDADMPLRVASYDGAAYRAQLLNPSAERRYPVITLVLYFGKERWSGPKSLYERLDIPDELRPMVNDHKINLFEIAFLSDEEISCFHSDFRIIAEFFVKTRTDPDYTPSNITIRHVHEILQFMDVMTKDNRYSENESQLLEKGGSVTMCEVLNAREHKGTTKGDFDRIIKSVRAMMNKGMTPLAAMDLIDVEEEKRAAVLAALNLA